MTKNEPHYQPCGPFSFENWEDQPDTGDQLWLLAVWKNAAGEKHRVLGRCVADIVEGICNPQSYIIDTDEYVPSFPVRELQKAIDAYPKGRNRQDLGVRGTSHPTFRRAA